MNIHLCPLTEEHILRAAELESICFTDGVSAAGLRSFITAPTNHYLAAITDTGQLVGYGGFSLAVDEAEIITVAVDPLCRRRGIGRILTEAMLRDAAALGGQTMYLEHRASNEAAHKLYQSLGFTVTGVRRGYYRAPREDAILMSRALSPA